MTPLDFSAPAGDGGALAISYSNGADEVPSRIVCWKEHDDNEGMVLDAAGLEGASVHTNFRLNNVTAFGNTAGKGGGFMATAGIELSSAQLVTLPLELHLNGEWMRLLEPLPSTPSALSQGCPGDDVPTNGITEAAAATNHNAEYGEVFAMEARALVILSIAGAGDSRAGWRNDFPILSVPHESIPVEITVGLLDGLGSLVTSREGDLVEAMALVEGCRAFELDRSRPCSLQLAGRTLVQLSAGTAGFGGSSNQDLILNAPPGTNVSIAFRARLGSTELFTEPIYVSLSTCADGLIYSTLKGSGCYACDGGEYPSIPADVNGDSIDTLFGRCSLCPPGTFSEAGFRHCAWCGPGTSAAQQGSRACLSCSDGTFSGLGWKDCAVCPKDVDCLKGTARFRSGLWLDPSTLRMSSPLPEEAGLEAVHSIVEHFRAYRRAKISQFGCLPEYFASSIAWSPQTLQTNKTSRTPNNQTAHVSFNLHALCMQYWIKLSSRGIPSATSSVFLLEDSVGSSDMAIVDTSLVTSSEAFAWWVTVRCFVYGGGGQPLPSEESLCNLQWSDITAIVERPLATLFAPSVVVNLSPSTVVLPCLAPTACVPSADNFTLQCADGHQGPLCAKCQNQWVAFRVEEGCVPCGDDLGHHMAVSAVMAIGVVIGIGAYVYFKAVSSAQLAAQGKTLSESSSFAATSCPRRVYVAVLRSKDSLLRSLVNFLQTTAILAALQPPGSQQDINLFSISLPSLDSVSVQCVTRWGFFHRFYAYVAILPVSVGGLFLGLYFMVWASDIHSRCQTDEDRSTRSTPFENLSRFMRVKRLLKSGAVVLIFLLYTQVTAALLEVFNLYPFPIEGTRRLQADVAVSSESTAYQTALLVGTIAVLVYVIGIPLATLVLLFRLRKRLHQPAVIQSFGFLFLGYRRSMYFWEMIVVLRKAMLNLAAVVFISKFPALIVGFIILAFALSVQLWAAPYSSNFMNAFEGSSIAVMIANCSVFMVKVYSSEPSGSSLRSVVGPVTTTIAILNFLFFVFAALCLSLIFFDSFRSRVLKLTKMRKSRNSIPHGLSLSRATDDHEMERKSPPSSLVISRDLSALEAPAAVFKRIHRN